MHQALASWIPNKLPIIDKEWQSHSTPAPWFSLDRRLPQIKPSSWNFMNACQRVNYISLSLIKIWIFMKTSPDFIESIWLVDNSGCWLILLKLSSGSLVFLTISQELKMILQNISGRVLGEVLINITPSNMFPTMLLLQRFQQICQYMTCRLASELHFFFKNV